MHPWRRLHRRLASSTCAVQFLCLQPFHVRLLCSFVHVVVVPKLWDTMRACGLGGRCQPVGRLERKNEKSGMGVGGKRGRQSRKMEKKLYKVRNNAKGQIRLHNVYSPFCSLPSPYFIHPLTTTCSEHYVVCFFVAQHTLVIPCTAEWAGHRNKKVEVEGGQDEEGEWRRGEEKRKGGNKVG